MYLVKLENGDYRPTYEGDRMLSSKIKPGDEIYATKQRNIDFHRKGFALLKLGFDNQDKYTNFDIFRKVFTMKAGFIDWITDKSGAPFPLPKSLSFSEMNSEDFERWYEAIREVISKELGVNNETIEAEIKSYY